MGELASFYLGHAFWTWAALGAALLAVEISFGSGYLLWPAAAAGVVALLVLTGLSPGLPAELGLFAVLTIASSLLARRFFKRPDADGPDINDLHERLIGRRGEAVGAFARGHGRVFVDGKEWAAEAEDEVPLRSAVEVIGVLNGAVLKVRLAS